MRIPVMTTQIAKRNSLYKEHAKGPAHRKITPETRGVICTARQIAQLIPDGEAGAFYVSFGRVRGIERFGRQVMVKAENDESLHVIGPGGSTEFIHPFSRSLRVLVK